MLCSKCLSDNTRIDIIQEHRIKKGRGIWYWVTGYFLIDWMMWLIFTPIKLLIRFIRGTNYRLKTKEKKMLICNSCGYTERIR